VNSDDIMRRLIRVPRIPRAAAVVRPARAASQLPKRILGRRPINTKPLTPKKKPLRSAAVFAAGAAGAASLGLALSKEWRRNTKTALLGQWRFSRCCITFVHVAGVYWRATREEDALRFAARQTAAGFGSGSSRSSSPQSEEITPPVIHGDVDEDVEAVWARAHEKAARLMLALAEELGGIFVKSGQYMTSLDYVLPPEYVRTMQPLLDQAPAWPFADVQASLLQEFGRPLEDVFDTFEKKPVACASLAQVHRATIGDREFAVKVQYPSLKQLCDGDLWTIATLSAVAQWLFPQFKLKWVADEFKLNLPKELDFLHEAGNAERAARLFADDPRVATPKVEWELTTSRVLTMEFIRGVKVNDLAALLATDIDPDQVARTLGDIFNKQLFRYGFVHCDPHAGNIFVRFRDDRPDGFDIVLLDNGLYRAFGDEFRLAYAKLWIALVTGDEPAIQASSEVLCPGVDYKLFASVMTSRDWTTVRDKKLGEAVSADETALLRRQGTGKAGELTEIFQDVPQELLLLLKANEQLRAVIREIAGHRVNHVVSVLRACQEEVDSAEGSNGGVWHAATAPIRWVWNWSTLVAVDWVMWWKGA
jgi:aarF domain-containing kinase